MAYRDQLLPVAAGGTGLGTLTAHSVQVGNGTSTPTQVSVGSNGQVLVGATSADPAFATLSSSASSIAYTTGANTLNLDITNYATGTWTPVLNFGGGTTGITYTTQFGQYQRMGNLVFIQMRITLSSKGSSTGSAGITGLPFTSGSKGGFIVFGDLSSFTYSASQLLIALQINASATTGSYIQCASGASTIAASDTNFANNTSTHFEGYYYTSN